MSRQSHVSDEISKYNMYCNSRKSLRLPKNPEILFCSRVEFRVPCMRAIYKARQNNSSFPCLHLSPLVLPCHGADLRRILFLGYVVWAHPSTDDRRRWKKIFWAGGGGGKERKIHRINYYLDRVGIHVYVCIGFSKIQCIYQANISCRLQRHRNHFRHQKKERVYGRERER